MGGSSTQQNQQTTSTTLPGNQQNNVDALLQGVLDYFNSGGRSFFPGDAVANFDPLQVQGQEGLVNFARGPGQDLVDRSTASNDFFLDINNILNPENIPGFQGATDAITREFTDNLTQNILPFVRGGATASGQFGGSASGIGQALAVSESNQGLTDSLANLNLEAYAQGLDSFNQAQNRVPGLFALGGAPSVLTSSVGDVRQAQSQREIDADVERFNFGQNEPLNILQVLRDLTGGAGQFGGTVESTGTSSGGGGGGLTQGIGGALTLGSIFGQGGSGKGSSGGAGKGSGTTPGAVGLPGNV